MRCKTVLFLSVIFTLLSGAEIEPAYVKPYMFFTYKNDSPEEFSYGAFHYTNVHSTMPKEAVGTYYQSGLFHTWYRPEKIYGKKDFSRDKYGYHAMEGGVGYKPYLRFHSEKTPQKFTTGAVAGGFGTFSNGPNQGSPAFNRSKKAESLGWEKNLGRYGAAQLSNRIIFPMDGLNIAEGTNNQMLGYGYYMLPLTEPKETTAGENVPTGNHCWTLFLQTENFNGPVCFFTPYHWSKYSIKNEDARGLGFDNSLLKVNSQFQRETNKIPAKQWKDENGDIYFRTTPLMMPCDEDMVGRYGTMPMTLGSSLWDGLTKWFREGGEPVAPGFKEQDVYLRESTGVNLALKVGDSKAVLGEEKKKGNEYKVSTKSFLKKHKGEDHSTSAVKWIGDEVKKIGDSGLVKLPEYYVLKNGDKAATVISENDVPEESGLLKLEFPKDVKKDFKYQPYDTTEIRTPLHSEFQYQDEITAVWKTPGPIAGPVTAKLQDGSVVVYYWYKFNEQPAIMNAYMDEVERELIQKRVELLHRHWSSDVQYFPKTKYPLTSIDSGVIITPPKGLEVGYVPVCVHQQLAKDPLPKFPVINRKK